MNKVDDEKEKHLTDEARTCIRNLLNQQIDAMRPLNTVQEQIARVGLRTAYIDITKAFHAEESGDVQVAMKASGDAGQKILGMLSKLQEPSDK